MPDEPPRHPEQRVTHFLRGPIHSFLIITLSLCSWEPDPKGYRILLLHFPFSSVACESWMAGGVQFYSFGALHKWDCTVWMLLCLAPYSYNITMSFPILSSATLIWLSLLHPRNRWSPCCPTCWASLCSYRSWPVSDSQHDWALLSSPDFLHLPVGTLLISFCFAQPLNTSLVSSPSISSPTSHPIPWL